MVTIMSPTIPCKPCPFCGVPALQGFAQGVYRTGCFNRACPVKPKAQSTCESVSCHNWNKRADVEVES